MYILTFPFGTLSLRSHRLPLVKHMEKRLNGLQSSVRLDSDTITYALIDEVTDSFVPALKPIQSTIEGMSDAVMTGTNPANMLRSIAGARKKLLILRRLIGGKPEVIKTLLKRIDRNHGQAQSEMSLNFSDVQDHLTALGQDLNHWEVSPYHATRVPLCAWQPLTISLFILQEIISHSENNCLMQLNMRMTQANNEASAAISKLTVVSTVLLPLQGV
jgi:Mg2+ and Co2+ transporter CorA